jgi:raffinose synthase
MFFFVVWFGFAGDSAVETNQGLNLVYMHAGTNPFEVINQAVM